jgi:uncharacterized Rmd1/YagE family protein
VGSLRLAVAIARRFDRLAAKVREHAKPVCTGQRRPVRALLLGERIDLKGLEAAQRLASNPLLISAGDDQYAALFRYGAIVLFGFHPLHEVTFVNQLLPLVGQPYAKRETEDARIRIDPACEELLTGGEIVLRELTLERLQVIADVLAKSLVLVFYEASLAGVFDAVEPFALGLRQSGRTTPRDRDLLRYIGDTLLMQHKMVGRVEVGEKPDVTWDLPEIHRLFARLEDEYELQERRLALEASSTSSRIPSKRSWTCCRTSARCASSGISWR